MNFLRVERKLMPVICFVAVLAISACFGASQAWAATNVNLQVGQYAQVSNFNFDDNEYSTKTIYENGQPVEISIEKEFQSSSIVNSNSKVVAAVKWLAASDSVFSVRVLGKSAGFSKLLLRVEKKVTYSYISAEYDYRTIKTEYEYSDVPICNVEVKKSGYIKRSACDGLFKTKKYSIGMLMRNSAYDFIHESETDEDYAESETIPSVISGGKFVKGKGYKLYGKGKKIKFTKAGKVVVKYKVGKTTYKITCAKVHSLPAMKKTARSIDKYDTLRPSTYKVKKYKLCWDKKVGCYTLKIKASSKNQWGDRETYTTDYRYEDGKVMSEYEYDPLYVDE